MLGLVAATATAVPAMFQANPDYYHALPRAVLGEEPAPPPAEIRRLETVAKPAPLSGRRVSLESDGKGHFVGEFRLNGRRQEAMVDTGATVVALNRSTARRIGVQLSAADFRHTVRTANGETSAAAVTISELSIGRIRVEDVRAVVLEDEALDTILIGMSFLNRLSRYQVEDGTLLLEQ